MAHHFQEPVAVLIERWNNRVLEFVVDAASFWRLGGCPAVEPSLPMDHPVTPSMYPSIHRPSRTLRLGTPLSEALIPLVPEASSGGSGVLSQTSAPAVRSFANSMSYRTR